VRVLEKTGNGTLACLSGRIIEAGPRMKISFNTNNVANPALDLWLVIILLFASLGLLFSAVFFVRRKRKAAAEFLATLTLKWHIAIPPYHRALPQLLFELARARRYEHASTVVIIGLQEGQSVSALPEASLAKNNGAISSHLASLFVGTLLRDNLRDSDLVTYDATKGYYVLMLTETTAPGAEQAVLRVSEIILKRTGFRLYAGCAEFPGAGLTLDDLVNRALAGAALPPVSLLQIKNDTVKNGNGRHHSGALAEIENLLGR